MWAIAVFTTAMSSISMAVAKQVTMRVGRLVEVMGWSMRLHAQRVVHRAGDLPSSAGMTVMTAPCAPCGPSQG
jgi:hypothetical protein